MKLVATSALSIVLLLLFLLSKPAFGANLLTNPGFESGTSSWSTFGTTISDSTEYQRTSNSSGKMQTITTNSGVKYIYQAVQIEQGKFYKFSGFAIKQGETGSKVFLRLAFYSTSDGSGTQIATYTSNEITSNTTEFQSLQTDSIQSPSNALSVRVRPSIEMPSGASSVGIAYFDDLIFEEVVSPSPTPTPTPTFQPTNTPTPTKTPTPTATPTKTPTPTPTKVSSQTTNPTTTPTPTPIKSGPTSAPTAPPASTKASSPTPKTEEPSVLSENVTVEPTKEQPTPTPQNLPKIFIIGGGLFLLCAGILFYKTQMKGDFDETDSDN